MGRRHSKINIKNYNDNIRQFMNPYCKSNCSHCKTIRGTKNLDTKIQTDSING